MSAEDYAHLDAIGEVERQHESTGYTADVWVMDIIGIEPMIEGSDEWKEYMLDCFAEEETPLQRYMKKFS